MNDPDVYWVEFEAGRAPPIPWYFPYFQAADRCNCRPWELIPQETPREFWFEAALIVAGAEADHIRFMRAQADKSTSYKSAVPGAIG